MDDKNILIADDHQLILEGFERRIQVNFPGLKIHKANSKSQLLQVLHDTPIDILFQDVMFGKEDARHFAKDIKQQFPALKIIIISTLTDALTIQNLLKKGIHGYISKTDHPDELIHAISAVQKNEIYLSADIKKIVLKPQPRKSVFVTQREDRILRLIINGKTSKEIAEELSISIKTVETHRSNLFARFGAKNLAELVKKALYEGY